MWNTLKPGSCITGSIGLEAEERLGHGRAVAAAVGVLEQVELEGPEAELEALGERGVRVLDGRGELGQVVGDDLQQLRVALEVVGVVGGQHLDLVEPDRGGVVASVDGSALVVRRRRRRRPSIADEQGDDEPRRSLTSAGSLSSWPGPLCICGRAGNTPTYAESHLERCHQLRAGQHPDQAVRRGVPQDRQLQPARLPHRCAHQVQEGVRGRRRGGAGRGDHQGLRAQLGRLRHRRRRRAGLARSRGEPHDRHRGVRRPRRHRPAVLRLRLLRGARQGDHQALRAAHPGDGGVGQGRRGPLRDALEAVPLRDPARRTAPSCSRRWSTPTR